MTASTRITFYVPGAPQTKGDHVILGAKSGRPWLQERNAGPKKNWRIMAADIAHRAMHEARIGMFDQAVRVRMVVQRIRPKSHLRTNGEVKPNAPTYPTSAPDLDKLMRSVGDALNGVLWRDDAQITLWYVVRRWGSEAGILVTVEPEPDEKAQSPRALVKHPPIPATEEPR